MRMSAIFQSDYDGRIYRLIFSVLQENVTSHFLASGGFDSQPTTPGLFIVVSSIDNSIHCSRSKNNNVASFVGCRSSSLASVNWTARIGPWFQPPITGDI